MDWEMKLHTEEGLRGMHWAHGLDAGAAALEGLGDVGKDAPADWHGLLFAYCYRRFGPPNLGAEVEGVPGWLLTTPDDEVFLAVQPAPMGVKLSFAFKASPKLWAELERSYLAAPEGYEEESGTHQRMRAAVAAAARELRRPLLIGGIWVDWAGSQPRALADPAGGDLKERAEVARSASLALPSDLLEEMFPDRGDLLQAIAPTALVEVVGALPLAQLGLQRGLLKLDEVIVDAQNEFYAQPDGRGADDDEVSGVRIYAALCEFVEKARELARLRRLIVEQITKAVAR